MANASWIIPAAVAIFTPIVMSAIGKRASIAAPTDPSGLRTLRLPRVFGALGRVSFGIALLFLFGGLRVALNGELISLFLLLCAAGFGAMAVSLVGNGRNHTVSFDQDHMVVTDYRKRSQPCAWGDIVSGRVHPLSKMIVLRTSDGRRLRINPYLIGSDDLFRMMAERTALPVADLVAKARSTG